MTQVSATGEDWVDDDLVAFGDGYTSGRAPRAVGAISGGTDARIMSLALGSTTTDLSLNGTTISSRVNTTGTRTDNTGVFYVCGRTADAGQAFLGDIGEVVMVAGAVSDSNRYKIEGYLAHKWGLESSLPTNHTYYAEPPGYKLRFDFNSVTNAGGDVAITTTWHTGDLGGYVYSAVLTNAADTTNNDYDLGIARTGSSLAKLANVWGEQRSTQKFVVWETSYEWNCAGYNLYNAAGQKLNDLLIPSGFNPAGSRYEFETDESVVRLEEIELTAGINDLGTHAITYQVITAYDTWAATNAVSGGPNDDDDGDGLSNFAEYAIGEQPTILNTGNQFQYIYQTRAGDTNLSYILETTTNLLHGPWTSSGYSVLGTNLTSGLYDEVTNTIPADTDTSYIRLNITDE